MRPTGLRGRRVYSAAMSHVFHRHTRSDPPVAVRGEGVYIIDADGKRYLDIRTASARLGGKGSMPSSKTCESSKLSRLGASIFV